MSIEVSNLKPVKDIQKTVTGDIRALNKRLLEISKELDKKARSHEVAKEVPGAILTSFYRKAVNTFSAIELLKSKRLVEEAWILLRVLLETHVNFVYFAQQEPKEISYRYVDAGILEKLKHLREVNFYKGIAQSTQEEWETLAAKIDERYSPQDLKALRRNGFSGLNFEQRATAVDLKILYEECYRIASRSVHMFDPAETSLLSYGLSKDDRKKLLKVRRESLEANQNMLLGRLSYVISEMTQSTLLQGQLMLIGLGYEKYCEIKGRPPLTVDPSGSFAIWRVFDDVPLTR